MRNPSPAPGGPSKKQPATNAKRRHNMPHPLSPGNVGVKGNGMEQKKPNATSHAPASAPNRFRPLIASIPIFHKAGFSMSSNYFYLARATSVPSTSGRYVPRGDQHYPTEYLGSRSSLSIMTYTPNGKTKL